MPNLVRRVVKHDGVLNAQVIAAQQPGITTAAHIHSGAFAAATALHGAAMLSRAADAAYTASPAGEDVYRAILTAYGNFAATEILRLGLQSEGDPDGRV